MAAADLQIDVRVVRGVHRLILDVRKVAAERNVHRDHAVAHRLLDVIGDERVQRGVPVLLELALDEVGAGAATGWVVGDTDAFCGSRGVVGCRSDRALAAGVRFFLGWFLAAAMPVCASLAAWPRMMRGGHEASSRWSRPDRSQGSELQIQLFEDAEQLQEVPRAPNK